MASSGAKVGSGWELVTVVSLPEPWSELLVSESVQETLGDVFGVVVLLLLGLDGLEGLFQSR